MNAIIEATLGSLEIPQTTRNYFDRVGPEEMKRAMARAGS